MQEEIIELFLISNAIDWFIVYCNRPIHCNQNHKEEVAGKVFVKLF